MVCDAGGNMKVTVCFDDVRVVVPCGTGQMTIAELIRLSIERYRKAVGKAPDVWVTVHQLKSSDGGILDLDDTVADIVDDKEQISAVYDVGFRSLHQNNGDGTSGSSVGTSSPDVFHTGKDYHGELRDWQRIGDFQDVLITDHDLMTDSSLTVRRGSEPLMEVIRIDTSPRRPYALTFDPSVAKSIKDKRISHQGVGDFGSRVTESAATGRVNSDEDSPGDSFNDSAFRAFMRTASRKSLNNGTAMMKWLEAQERVQDGFTRKTREEPIGSSDEAEVVESTTEPDIESPRDDNTLIEIRNSGCPLGIHVMPSFDVNNRNLGLDIIDIESGGLAGTDGRLNVNDCIVEINGTSLIDLDYSSAQQVFLNALKSTVIQLRIRPSNQGPIPPSSTGGTTMPAGGVTDITDSGRDGIIVSDGKPENSDNAKTEQTAFLTKSTAGPARNPTTIPPSKSKFAPIASTRIIGQILKISLKKGNDGLGFSVTTRDNPAGGDCPIYIKNILPHGAAILDGRLRSGDRLLEVNGSEMSGKSQADTVAILRDVKVGGTVDLVVSRLANDDDQSQGMTDSLTKDQDNRKQATGPETNQALAEQKSRSPLAVASEDRAILHLKIPVNGQGSSLGLHLMGKTDRDGQDIGLFVKLIVDGGPAAQDGRLQPDDQITEVNGVSLLGFSNTEAMSILQKAMAKETSKEGVSLTVSRAIAKDGSIKQLDSLQMMNNKKTESRSGDKKPLPAANHRNVLPSGGQGSNPVTDGNVPTSNGRSVGSKVWRNTSYMMATDESLLNEINEGRDADERKTGSTFPAQLNGHLSRHELSGLNGRLISHSSSLSDYDGRELAKRTSVSTHNSDQDSICSSQRRARAFERDGFGRRSMSEKRKAYVDPKSSALFQKIKDGKVHREGTNLKRTASVESLVSQSQKTSESGDSEVRRGRTDSRAKRSTSLKKVGNANRGPSVDTHPTHQGLPIAKSRMWNESFRVAIDRSYGDQVLSVPQESHRVNGAGSQGRGQGQGPPPLGQDPYVQGVNNRFVSRNPPPYQTPRQPNVTVTHGFPQASTNQPPGVATRRPYGPNEYYYNSSNRQPEQHTMQAEVGYHYYTDPNSTRKLNDPYIRSSNNHANQVLLDPRSRLYDQSSREHPSIAKSVEKPIMPNGEQFRQPHPRSGPPRSQPNSTTCNQSAPSRTVTTPSNRPIRRSDNFREMKTVNAEPPTGDGRPNYYTTCDSYPNLTSIPSGYLNDVTNMTTSSRDLSSLRGASSRVLRTPLDPWMDLRGTRQGTTVGGSLNRMMDDMQRQNGCTISSGALV